MKQLTIKDVRALCGEPLCNKAEKCATFDSFVKAFVQENALFGLFLESVGLYQVNIVFENDQEAPTYAWCTCPDMEESDDACKHIAALMLLWCKAPEKFVVLASWHSLLEKYDKKALLDIIAQIASRSLEVTDTLYEKLTGEALIDDEEFFDDEEAE